MVDKNIKLLGVILAGGRSQRMGQDKAAIFIDNATLLDHVYQNLSLQMAQYDKKNMLESAIIISTNNPELLNQMNKIYLPDDADFKNLGPLSGIYTALDYAEKHNYHAIITIAVDTPFFSHNYIEDMLEFYKKHLSNAVIVSYDDSLQPTFALWPIHLKAALKKHLQMGKRSIYSFIQTINANQYVFKKTSKNDDYVFFNINTPNDLDVAKKYYLNKT